MILQQFPKKRLNIFNNYLVFFGNLIGLNLYYVQKYIKRFLKKYTILCTKNINIYQVVRLNSHLNLVIFLREFFYSTRLYFNIFFLYMKFLKQLIKYKNKSLKVGHLEVCTVLEVVTLGEKVIKFKSDKIYHYYRRTR